MFSKHMGNMGHLHNVPPLLGISHLQQGLPEVLGASRHRSGAPNLHAAVDQSWALVNGAACWTHKMLIFFLAAIHLELPVNQFWTMVSHIEPCLGGLFPLITIFYILPENKVPTDFPWFFQITRGTICFFIFCFSVWGTFPCYLLPVLCWILELKFAICTVHQFFHGFNRFFHGVHWFTQSFHRFFHCLFKVGLGFV